MCRILDVSPQGFRKFQEIKPYKHKFLLAQIEEILSEHELNKNYGVIRMHQALIYKFGKASSISTIYRVMKENGLTHKPNKPKSLTKSDKKAQKNENLLNRDFKVKKPNQKWVSDITEVPTKQGKIYISAILDCFDNSIVGLSTADNMKTKLVIESLKAADLRFGAKGVIFHTDRGSQYTSKEFRKIIFKLGVLQSMNGAGGRCHDNAKAESVWARFKTELIYNINTEKINFEDVKSMIFRYFERYWNNLRICSANGGLPPLVKRLRYFNKFKAVA